MSTDTVNGVPATPSSLSDDHVRTIVRWTSWGSLLPILGWVYGIATLWASDRFTRRDKVMGTMLFPGGWFGAVVAVSLIIGRSVGYCYRTSVGEVGSAQFVSESGCVDPALPTFVSLPLTLGVLVAAALGPVYLRVRARR